MTRITGVNVYRDLYGSIVVAKVSNIPIAMVNIDENNIPKPIIRKLYNRLKAKGIGLADIQIVDYKRCVKFSFLLADNKINKVDYWYNRRYDKLVYDYSEKFYKNNNVKETKERDLK